MKLLDMLLTITLVPMIIVFISFKAYYKEALAIGFFLAWAWAVFSRCGGQ